MLKIVICDDDIRMNDKIKKDISKIFARLDAGVNMISFSKGKQLLSAVQEDGLRPDVLLLDIEMPDISGFEVAGILREFNKEIVIIFISSHEELVYDSLEYSPFRYIRKYRIDEELPRALKAAYEICKKDEKKYVVVKMSEGEYKISNREICYYEIIKRKLFIHLADNRILSTWKSITDFYKEVNDEAFVKIHSGCVVNMKYINEYSNEDITLDNGKKLFASRSGLKELKEKLPRYWGARV